jgi:hypothetical protein
MPEEKTPLMRRIEQRERKPLEQVLGELMAEEPRLNWLEMAARLGVGERTFRYWARALGARREIVWRLGQRDER